MVRLLRVIADFSFFGRGYLRNRVGLLSSLIIPMMFILIFGSIFSGSSSSSIFSGGSTGPISIYVKNLDNGKISIQFISTLNSTGHIILTPLTGSENIISYLRAHSSSDGLLIPSTFSRDFLTGKSVNVTVYGNPSSLSSTVVSETVDSVINAFNLKRAGSSTVLGMYQTPITASTYTYIDFLVPGLIGYSILVSPMFSLVNISSLYKKIKLFKQFSLTPLSKGDWLVSKVLWFIFLGSISFMLMVAVGDFGFGSHISLSIWIIPFLILGPMLFASLGMLIGTVAKSIETASVVGNVITFPMMFLSGTFFPISFMPIYLQNAAHAFPLFYVIEGLNSVMIYANYGQAVIDLVITTAFAVGILFAAVKLFKWREE